MLYDVSFVPSADKVLRKLPVAIQKRIVAAVEALASDPRPPGAVKLKGEDDLWRIRVGDYRVIYEVSDEKLTVLVVRLGHRKDVYRG